MKVLQSTAGKDYRLTQDEFPLTQLLSSAGAKAVLDEFKFQTSTPAADSSGIEFFGGSLEHAGETITVPRLHATWNSVTINIVGRTSEVDTVFNQFIRTVEKIKKGYKPAIRQADMWSVCIVHLDFDFSKFFNPKVHDFMTKTLATASARDGYKIAIEPRSFRAIQNYAAVDPANSITMSSKELFFEPRAGTALSEQIYFTSAALDSDTHLKLLVELERDLK